MFGRTLLVIAIVAGAATALAKPPGSYGTQSPANGDALSRLAATAISSGGAADRAIDALRARGPEGLQPLLVLLNDASVHRLKNQKTYEDPALAAEEARIQVVVDRVAGQRYAHLSGLYWYTDFEAAKAAATQSGKPILSLRLLGRLIDEYSCANSRFFRTTLYVNRDISRQMRENFVLHWKTVRPVPRVTIDFGDGRKLERTVTGNSAHYVLAADGTPLDVLPGLYGPEQFGAWLDDVSRLHAATESLADADRPRWLAAYHAKRSAAIARQWADDVVAVELGAAAPASQTSAPNAPASEIDRRRLAAERLARDPERLAQFMSADRWEQIALLPAHHVALDVTSRRVIGQENPDAARADKRAVTKSAAAAEGPLLRLVMSLQKTIAADGVRNEYTLHRQVHDWFAAGNVAGDVEQLNDRVYAELFLMPTDDPWLGLRPANSYTALQNGGVAAPSR